MTGTGPTGGLGSPRSNATSRIEPLDHTSVLKTIQTRWVLPALTARDAAAPDVGDVPSLATPRTDDPLAGVTAPASTSANPAAAEVSHIQMVNAQPPPGTRPAVPPPANWWRSTRASTARSSQHPANAPASSLSRTG